MLLSIKKNKDKNRCKMSPLEVGPAVRGEGEDDSLPL